MKNKSHKLTSSYFFRGRTQDGDRNKPELIRPDAEVERGAPVLENILRWEDDGGPAFEPGNPLLQVAENKTPQPMEVAEQD